MGIRLTDISLDFTALFIDTIENAKEEEKIKQVNLTSEIFSIHSTLLHGITILLPRARAGAGLSRAFP